MIRYAPPTPPPRYGDQMRRGPAPGSEIWRDYDRYFRAAQRTKCAYCECDLGSHYAHMDHYAPRSAIHRLREVRGWKEGVKPIGGNPIADCNSGYQWLEFAWPNWMLGCQLCNSPWKGALFPVMDDAGHSPIRNGVIGADHPTPPTSATYDRRLLLHPFDPARDPEDHLRFVDTGQVEPRDQSPFGLATIQTCGLYRNDLATFRRAMLEKARPWINKVQLGIQTGNGELLANGWSYLYPRGTAKTPHAGVIRSQVRDRFGLRWGECRELWVFLGLLRALEAAISRNDSARAESTECALRRCWTQPNLSTIWEGHVLVLLQPFGIESRGVVIGWLGEGDRRDPDAERAATGV